MIWVFRSDTMFRHLACHVFYSTFLTHCCPLLVSTWNTEFFNLIFFHKLKFLTIIIISISRKHGFGVGTDTVLEGHLLLLVWKGIRCKNLSNLECAHGGLWRENSCRLMYITLSFVSNGFVLWTRRGSSGNTDQDGPEQSVQQLFHINTFLNYGRSHLKLRLGHIFTILGLWWQQLQGRLLALHHLYEQWVGGWWEASMAHKVCLASVSLPQGSCGCICVSLLRPWATRFTLLAPNVCISAL